MVEHEDAFDGLNDLANPKILIIAAPIEVRSVVLATGIDEFRDASLTQRGTSNARKVKLETFKGDTKHDRCHKGTVSVYPIGCGSAPAIKSSRCEFMPCFQFLRLLLSEDTRT